MAHSLDVLSTCRPAARRVLRVDCDEGWRCDSAVRSCSLRTCSAHRELLRRGIAAGFVMAVCCVDSKALGAPSLLTPAARAAAHASSCTRGRHSRSLSNTRAPCWDGRHCADQQARVGMTKLCACRQGASADTSGPCVALVWFCSSTVEQRSVKPEIWVRIPAGPPHWKRHFFLKSRQLSERIVWLWVSHTCPLPFAFVALRLVLNPTTCVLLHRQEPILDDHTLFQ